MLQEGSLAPAAVPAVTVAAVAPPPRSFLGRLIDVFTAPTAAGEAIARDPRVLGATIICAVLATATVALLYLTDAGQKIALEQARVAMRQAGQSTEMLAKASEGMAFIAPFAVGGASIGTVVNLVFTAACLWVLFSAVMGANLGFRHHFSIAAHSGIIFGLGGLAVIATQLAKGTAHASLSLAALVPSLEPTSVIYMSLALFDFFTLWYVAALGLMIAGAGRLRPATTVGTLLAIYAVLGGASVAFRAALS